MNNIRRQILVELLNEIDYIGSPELAGRPEDVQRFYTDLGNYPSYVSEQYDYLYNIVYKRQSAIGRGDFGKAISQMWDVAQELTWEDINFLKEKDPAILASLVFDTASLVEPTGVSDIIGGAINMSYAIAHDGVFSWGFVLGLLQEILGWVQATVFLKSGGTATPVIMFLKTVIKGGYKLLTHPETFARAVSIIREYSVDILNFYRRTRIGTRFVPAVKLFFEKLLGLKPMDFVPPSAPQFVDDVTAQAIERAVAQQGANAVSTAAGSTGTLFNLTKAIQNLTYYVKLVGFTGIQLGFYRLGLGYAQQAAFEGKTKELSLEAEKYMRNNFCKSDDVYREMCSRIKTVYPSLQTFLTEPFNEPPDEDDAPPSLGMSFQKGKGQEILLKYDSARTSYFLELASKDENYLRFFQNMGKEKEVKK